MQISIKLSHTPDQKVYLLIDRKVATSRFNIYHAKAISQDIHFALKVYPEASKNSYLREQEVVSKFNHPNIIKYIPVVGHSLKDDMTLMEYASNKSFSDFLQKTRNMPEKLIRTYFCQLIDGIEHVHSKDYAHLDLKLSNLLLDKHFNLKIIDFDQCQNKREKQQQFKGTLCYRAPEVINKVCRDYFAADIYSLGIILFTLKTGEYPFVEGDDNGSYSLKHYNTFHTNKTLFWRMKTCMHSSEPFSQEFMDLFNGMCTLDPKERFSLKDIKASKWYQGEQLDHQQLKSQMSRTLTNNH